MWRTVNEKTQKSLFTIQNVKLSDTVQGNDDFWERNMVLAEEKRRKENEEAIKKKRDLVRSVLSWRGRRLLSLSIVPY